MALGAFPVRVRLCSTWDLAFAAGSLLRGTRLYGVGIGIGDAEE